MMNFRFPFVSRDGGKTIEHSDADGAKHLPRTQGLTDGLALVIQGGKWVAQAISGISVSSVFGRTGAVVAQAGDYTAAQVGALGATAQAVDSANLEGHPASYFQPSSSALALGETSSTAYRGDRGAEAYAKANAAEPGLGTPPVTSFLRSTAAGVRAWVQLVASDITDLGTVLAGYLTKNNPAYTGSLSQAGTERITADGDGHFRMLIGSGGANDTIGQGAFHWYLDSISAPTKGVGLQLGGSGDFLMFFLASGSWSEKWRFLQDGSLKQGAIERITAGGEFRGSNLRLTELVASAGKIALIDANGGYTASAIEQGNIVVDTILTQWLVIGGAALALQAGGGVYSGGVYTSWSPSAYAPLADDTQSNTVPVRSGWLWNSQRSNHITMTDGAATNAYRGRVRMDRWNGTGFARVTGTTAATEFFAVNGDGSAIIPANYLKPFQRAEINATIAVAAVTAPATISIWIRGVQVFSRAIGVSSGQITEITIEANFFIDDTGYALLKGTFHKWQGANLNASEDVRIGWASLTPFDTTVETAIEMKIAPGATSEQWNRGLCWITM